MITRPVVRVALASALAVALAACGSAGSSEKADPKSAPPERAAETTVVNVEARDDACAIDRTTVPPGAITFSVTNRGTIVTEAYLYAPHDQVVGEVEDVDPGATASFTVDVGGGRYEVACKPGQEGDGIRAPLQITGPLDPNQTATVDPATARGVAAFAVEVDIAPTELAEALEDLVVVTGQTVTFRVHNRTADPRSFAVVAPDGTTVLGRSPSLAPAASAEVVVTFAEPGTYRAIDPDLAPASADAGVSFQVIE